MSRNVSVYLFIKARWLVPKTGHSLPRAHVSRASLLLVPWPFDDEDPLTLRTALLPNGQSFTALSSIYIPYVTQVRLYSGKCSG